MTGGKEIDQRFGFFVLFHFQFLGSPNNGGLLMSGGLYDDVPDHIRLTKPVKEKRLPGSGRAAFLESRAAELIRLVDIFGQGYDRQAVYYKMRSTGQKAVLLDKLRAVPVEWFEAHKDSFPKSAPNKKLTMEEIAQINGISDTALRNWMTKGVPFESHAIGRELVEKHGLKLTFNGPRKRARALCDALGVTLPTLLYYRVFGVPDKHAHLIPDIEAEYNEKWFTESEFLARLTGRRKQILEIKRVCDIVGKSAPYLASLFTNGVQPDKIDAVRAIMPEVDWKVSPLPPYRMPMAEIYGRISSTMKVDIEKAAFYISNGLPIKYKDLLPTLERVVPEVDWFVKDRDLG